MLAATFTSNKNENTFLAGMTTYSMEKQDRSLKASIVVSSSVQWRSTANIYISTFSQRWFIILDPYILSFFDLYMIFVIFSPHGTFLATIFLHTKSA